MDVLVEALHTRRQLQTLADALDYEQQAKYNHGKADICLTLLNLFDNELRDDVKDWLRGEINYRREAARTAEQQAEKLISTEED